MPPKCVDSRLGASGSLHSVQYKTLADDVQSDIAAGRLRPEMFGEIRLEESFRDVPTVPAGAIIQSDKQSIVYRDKSPGVFEPVAIAYGKQKGDRVPVLSGIQRGDRVVVDGAMLLKGTM